MTDEEEAAVDELLVEKLLFEKTDEGYKPTDATIEKLARMKRAGSPLTISGGYEHAKLIGEVMEALGLKRVK